MYRKLNCSFDIKEYQTLDMRSCFMENGQGIKYSEVVLPQFSDIMNIIPERYQKDFCLLLMDVNSKIPPHTDSGIQTVINIYIRTDNCVTQFYKLDNNKPKTYQVENQTDGFLYNVEDLIPIGGFIALPTESWILDVRKIHSVEPMKEFKRRTSISLSTDKYDFTQVCEMLKETGNL